MEAEHIKKDFMRELAKAHKWRFTLVVGDAIDARHVTLADKVAGRVASATWREANVAEVDGDVVTVHFRGWNSCSDATIRRLSSDIQPLHTFTIPWRDSLIEGSMVEVRTYDGNWEASVVSKVGRGAEDSDGSRDGEDPRAVLVVKESGTRWVSLDSDDICEKGTHLSEAGGAVAGRPSSSPTPSPTPAARERKARADKEDAPASSSGRPRKHASPLARSAKDPPLPSGVSKRIALVGSSGGGAAAQGQMDGLSLLLLAKKELRQAGLELSAVQFVACAEPLDAASPTAPATLWVTKAGDGLVIAAQGTLKEVNIVAREEDKKIAAALRAGFKDAPAAASGERFDEAAALPPLHGLVAISCDVDGVNSRAVSAARDCRSPIVGTGGSSLGAAMAMGCLLVGSSGGSVATTNKSKVVSYAAGLAGHWSLKYDSARELTNPLAPAAVFGGCLSAYVGVMLVVGIGEGPNAGLDGSPPSPWVVRLWGALPIVAASAAARQVSCLGDIATAAGIIAGSLCWEDTVAALLAGTLAGYLCSKLAGYSLQLGIPATSLSLYVTATAGIASGAIVALFMPFLEVLWAMAVSTDVLLARLPSPWLQAVAGAMMGCLMCYGSKIGWYHRVFLPIIVLELAGGLGSIWGAIDLCALCMVAAGLCAAHWIRPSSEIDIPLAKRGLLFNVCFGDFIEVAYPFMERCSWCNAGSYLGAALSGAIVGVSSTRSSAYLPLPVALLACDKPLALVGATSAAFFGAFVCGLLRPMKSDVPNAID